jgi:hypothetical protein
MVDSRFGVEKEQVKALCSRKKGSLQKLAKLEVERLSVAKL